MTDRSPEDIAKALDQINLLVGAIANNASHIAHARRAMYLAYLAEGFSEAQALELCRTLTLS